MRKTPSMMYETNTMFEFFSNLFIDIIKDAKKFTSKHVYLLEYF